MGLARRSLFPVPLDEQTQRLRAHQAGPGLSAVVPYLAGETVDYHRGAHARPQTKQPGQGEQGGALQVEVEYFGGPLGRSWPA